MEDLGDGPLGPSRRSTHRPRAEQFVDDYYERHYASVHGAGCLGGAASVMHKRLEHGRGHRDFPLTLEVGAGRFEHYPFVTHARKRYIATDIRVPTENPVYQSVLAGSGPADLEFRRSDAMSLDLDDESVDRVVATCLLIHLPDPFGAIHEWQRVCRPDGVIDMLVPCDPGLLARAFRRGVSQRVARKHGVPAKDYVLVNAIEHLNPFNRVLTLVRAAVEPRRRLTVDYFPFAKVPSWNMNAFAIMRIDPS
ncbi:methyltransferase domain-containing protein [uncultured Nocardioides sp.]|uniref:class I SAM-dependent methyltransferase n=1 Tax=uncultured Nocardioides sp. TaxID=198441 RepID=UPI0026374F52|nr:methyltransferase domain-containing protein [uncultured Nocardioides sp.]